jgi:NADH-quinone oxidoreductase subunit L
VIALLAWVTEAEEVAGGALLGDAPWIHVAGLQVDWGWLIDPLTMTMLMVVTGVGTLVVLYAVGYMSGDPGYARFFFAVSLFIFAMTTLVMADNLVLVFLGWEGVGLCSYLLIGYYYGKQDAVEAAKKAFVVNRIGDFGFLLGIFLIYQSYGSVSLLEVTTEARLRLAEGTTTTADIWIPLLLMLGAAGKSAQLPLYVWLPDAMAGPTPVSALIHAATMVTSGVYLVARLIPVFELSPPALPILACVGAATALVAGLIAMAQYDLKKVFAYSTVSQLGYMFLGLGALSVVGGVFHLFTHAFFKALLFLTAGSVMHALTGQLDMRRMSGLRHRMPWTCWLMFAGCVALAGLPFTAGFFSKDRILADTLAVGLNDGLPGVHGPGIGLMYLLLAGTGLLVAGITAYYTFRLWLRVFMGPERWEMGDDHGHDDLAEEQAADDPHHAPAADHHHHHEPHEMPLWPMNAPLVVLAIGAIFAGLIFAGPIQGWLYESTANPATVQIEAEHAERPVPAAPDVHPGLMLTAAPVGDHDDIAHADDEHDDHAHHPHHAQLLGMDVHLLMALLSSVAALTGVGLAVWFHWLHRPAAESLRRRLSPVHGLFENKFHVDELYHRAIVRPLRTVGEVLYAFDALIIDGAVSAVAWLPRATGSLIRPSQSGRVQGYGLGMALGIAIVVVLIWAFFV